MKNPMPKLKQKRREKGLTQEQLVKMIGTTHQSISNYETGEQFPRRANLEKLAKALDCSIGELV